MPYQDCVIKRPKHEPTDSYFYIAIQLDKCMIRSDAFNSNIDPVRTEMTDKKQIQISHVCNSHEKKSTRILAGKNLLQVSSTDKGKSEIIIVNEVLWRR